MAATLLSVLGTLPGCAGAPPQITSVSPRRDATGVAADEPVRVVFDHAVDRASIPGRFRVDPPIAGCDLRAAFAAAPTAPCHVEWIDAGSGFALRHDGSLFAPDTHYRFFIDSGVSDTAGVVNSLDHHWDLSTASAPSVRATSPADGATQVGVDAPLSVTFSTPMAVAPTQAAIHLTPSVPGTRVVVNSGDRARFVVLPGRLLQARSDYVLSVDLSSRDEHGQRLDRSTAVRFTTGGLRPTGHALVLGREPGEAPTVVELTALGPDQPGEPAAAAAVLTAPRCQERACAAGGPGTPLSVFLDAVLAPGGTELAVVEQSLPAPGRRASPRLRLVDLPGLSSRVIADGALHPSWSPDGRLLVYAGSDGVDVLTVATGAIRRLPPGDPLDGRAAWSSDGSLVALPLRRSGLLPHVELADPVLLVRYPAPALDGPVSAPVLSPAGDALAVRVEGSTPGTLIVHLGGDAAPAELGATLTPLAWPDAGTLLAVDRPAGPGAGLVRVSVASGDRVLLAGGPLAGDLSTVAADPRGRTVAYLRPDAAGTIQAWAENADGTNPVQLTSFPAGGGLEAAAVVLGG